MPQIIYVGKHLLTYTVSRHAHSSWEMIYCTSGSGTLHYQDRSLSYQAGDVLIIPPLLAHLNESETGFTNIHMNVQTSSLQMDQPCVIHDDSNHFILDAFRAAFYYFSQAPGKKTYLLSSYASLIVAQVKESLSAPSHSDVTREVMDTIISNYPDEIFELDSYLHSLPFNYDYLRKIFKKEVGETPHQFLMNTRLQAAAERLAADDSKFTGIAEIAHLCGFHEPLYFSRVFRRKYGMSPSAYQEKLAEDHSPAPDEDSIKIRL